MDDAREVESLYRGLLESWNGRSATDSRRYSQRTGRWSVRRKLASTAVRDRGSLERDLRSPSDAGVRGKSAKRSDPVADTAVLSAVAGMAPAGQPD